MIVNALAVISIKQVLKNSKGARLVAVFTIILMLSESVVETYLPKILAEIIDKVTLIVDIGGSRAEGLLFIRDRGIEMVLLAVAGVLFNIIAVYTSQAAAFGIAHNLRMSAFSHIQKLGLKDIDSFTTSSLVVRLTNDITSVQNLTHLFLRIGLRAPFMFIYGIFMASTLNRKLSVVFLFAIIPLAVTIVYRINTALPLFRRVQRALDKLNDFVRENLLGIRVVKNYTKEKEQEKAFEEVSGGYAEVTTQGNVKLSVIQPIMQFIMAMTTVSVVWYGGYLYMHDEVTIGVITALLTYITQILIAFRMMSDVIVNYSRVKISMDRIDEVIEKEPSIRTAADAETALSDGSVVFDDVCFSYTGVGDYVLEHVSLEAHSGESVAILGGTGSGKSTIVHLIPRMYDISEGNIYIGQKNLRDLSLEALRANIAVVPQFSTLFSETVRSNLLWGNPFATDEDIKKALYTACADEFVAKLSEGEDTFLARGGKNLSGGQKQRLCIARALVRNPKILLLDDSLSAVDTETDAKIRQRIAENYPDMTTLIIAQRIKSVKTADRIYVIDAGSIVACGNHETLSKTSDVYKEIMDSQKEVADE